MFMSRARLSWRLLDVFLNMKTFRTRRLEASLSQWRADPTDYRRRIFRVHAASVTDTTEGFREQRWAHASTDDFAGAARRINVPRRRRKLPLHNTVLIYVRIGSVRFRPHADEEMP